MVDNFSDRVDVVVIGAGQNGLIAADYLQRSGLSVLVVERRLESGGGLTGEEPTLNGFWHTTGNPFQDIAPLLPFMNELQLAQYNGRWIVPEVQSSLRLPDGQWLVLYSDLERSLESIGRLSRRDAARWRDVVASFHADLPAIRGYFTGAADPARFESTTFGRLCVAARSKTPEETLDEYFESDAVKALVLMHLAAPRGVGLDHAGAGAIVPLAIALAGESRLAAGGVHELAQALWSACIEGGGDVWDSTTVSRIVIENGRAAGVELANGQRIAAGAVISSTDLQSTFGALLQQEPAAKSLAQRAGAMEPDEHAIFAVHLALREPPRFTGAEATEAGRAFRVNLGIDSVTAMRSLWQEIRAGALPAQAAMVVFSSVLWDPSQAHRGMSNTTLWQFVPRRLASGAGDWASARDAYAREMVGRLRAFAPNVTDECILESVAHTPDLMVQKWPNLAAGLFGGRNAGSQLLFDRPFPGLGHRSPIPGLYLANASMAPGAGLTGLAGAIAGRAVAEDLGASIAIAA